MNPHGLAQLCRACFQTVSPVAGTSEATYSCFQGRTRTVQLLQQMEALNELL